MRVNIDFSIDPIKDCLFIKDPISCKVELISLDAIGVGNFNIKVSVYIRVCLILINILDCIH